MPAAPKIVPRAAAQAPAPAAAKSGASVAQKALQKLGLRRDIDLALHLPLRYEDETRITPLANARDGRWCRSKPR
jgi:ATP-dependent DNA helicase RecG